MAASERTASRAETSVHARRDVDKIPGPSERLVAHRWKTFAHAPRETAEAISTGVRHQTVCVRVLVP